MDSPRIHPADRHGPRVAVKQLDHIVLTVKSIDKSVEFYKDYLGMRHQIFKSANPKHPGEERSVLFCFRPIASNSDTCNSRCLPISLLPITCKALIVTEPNLLTTHNPRHALVFGYGDGIQKINLHEVGKEFEPNAHVATAGSADLCFLTNTPIEAVLNEFKRAGLELLEGGEIVNRTGATGGRLRSVYVRDPDRNLIE
jgi:catechol 2,3-dioxygenase-like lactoylglutathione lyase family enzyme